MVWYQNNIVYIYVYNLFFILFYLGNYISIVHININTDIFIKNFPRREYSGDFPGYSAIFFMFDFITCYF